MKNILFTILLVVLALGSQAQIKVEASGNVGIGGISNPTTALDVNGDMKVLGNSLELGRDAGASGVVVKLGGQRSADGAATFDLVSDVTLYPNYGFRFFRNANGSTQMLHRGTSTFAIKTSEAANIGFFTDNQERLRVKFDGNIGIGVANPSHILTTAGDIKVNGVIINSDSRLKTNVTPFSYGLNEVLKIKPINYRYNGKGGTSTKGNHVGVMAQDLKKIAPELVTESVFQEEDSEGKTISEESYLEINDTAIKYMLINAIKEQQQVIENQDDKLNSLEKQLAEIKEMLAKGNNASVETEIHEAKEAILFQNYPNPSNNTTNIEFFIPEGVTSASIQTFDMSGKLIRTDKIQGSGKGVVKFDTKSNASGQYIYQLTVNGEVIDSKSMIIE